MIANLVAASSRHARWLVAFAAVLCLVAGVFVAQRFTIHTEMEALVPADVPFRVHDRALEAVFAQQADDITLVIDGRTPELAQTAAVRLAEQLGKRSDLYRFVERPGAGAFFDREGLLYLPLHDVQQTTAALIRAQPLIAPVASDPSLRGVMGSLSTAADGVAAGDAAAADLAKPLKSLANVADAVGRGAPAAFSWQALITGRESTVDDRRQVVVAVPRTDRASGEPAAGALDVARALAMDLQRQPALGVRVRLTGEVAMAAEELGALKESTGPIGLLTTAAMLLILYLALRSARMVAAVVITVLAGLVLTAAFGLAVYGRFNLISVAFLPLFVGLGVDFAIQFCVRYRAETVSEGDITTALSKAGGATGRGLILAAGATALGFAAFLPTRYQGVAELGAVSGFGMCVAFLLALTLLPALITLFAAKNPAPDAMTPALQRCERLVTGRESLVLAGAAALALLALAAAPRLGFNFDPMRLRNPEAESVRTYRDLAHQPEAGVDALDLLLPDLASARAVTGRLKALPEVADVLSLDRLIPEDQAAKLALISDAALLLGPTVDPFDVAPPPSDSELVASMTRTAAALRALAGGPAGAAVKSDALRLADRLQAIAQGPPATRARLQTAIVAGLPVALDQVRQMLAAQPVSIGTLPLDLKEAWVAPDGQARIQVMPRAAPGSPVARTRFVAAVQKVAPAATGAPAAVEQVRGLVLGAFTQAALLALAAISVLLLVALKSLRAVILTLAPVLFASLLAVGTCGLLDQDINLENLIALPLLLGIGVSFNIYFVVAWRRGERQLLGSCLARAVLYSALTTGLSFGALSLSIHPGTASMGVLLLVALCWTLVTTLIVQPALLARVSPRTASWPSKL
jgi:hopanoid biosynthesis associated RND transporter like protein HpnN